MRFLILAVASVAANPSLLEVDRWLKTDPNSPEMLAARKEEVSFLEQTLHSMEFNQQEVINSNKELDKQVKESERKLKRITDEVSKMTRKTKERMEAIFPFSLFQAKDGEDDDEPIPQTGNKPASFLQLRHRREDEYNDDDQVRPVKALESANARAAASEQRFREAMKKLEADRQALLQDERMRRARAQQERRHFH